MNKIICVIITVAAALLIFSAISYAQVLNDWETGVFQDLAETWHNKLYQLPAGGHLTASDFDEIFREVAEKNNINVEQVKDIDHRGLNDISDLGDNEYVLFGELRRRIRELSSSYTVEDCEKIHQEVATKYGISIYRLHWIEYKLYEGM